VQNSSGREASCPDGRSEAYYHACEAVQGLRKELGLPIPRSRVEMATLIKSVPQYLAGRSLSPALLNSLRLADFSHLSMCALLYWDVVYSLTHLGAQRRPSRGDSGAIGRKLGKPSKECQ